MYHLAVTGNPIAHSLSPVVFDLFAGQCGIALEYKRILSEDEADFALKVKSFFKDGGLAMNVTSPFKQSAYKLSPAHTLRAGFCQAANFLSLDAGADIVADTTDGIGLIADIEVNNGLSITDKKILTIGSGLVLDSILLDIVAKNPRVLDILARNKQRVGYLSDKFACGVFADTTQYDIIINSTPDTAENVIFQQVKQIKSSAFCYDMAYAREKSRFLLAMLKLNPQVITRNGLGMLVEQAKVAFIKLFARIPDSKKTLDDLAKMGYYV